MLGNADVKSKVAVLEQRTNDQEKLFEKIDTAIQAMQDAATNISKMLAVHEERLDQHNKTETIMIEMIKDVKSNLEAEDVDLSDRIDELDGKVEELKRFKWTAVGIGLAAGFILTSVMTFASQSLTRMLFPSTMEAPPVQTK